MAFLNRITAALLRNKARLQERSFDTLLWIVNIVPSLVGFNIDRKRIFIPFWIVHLSLLFYVYGVGSIVYLGTEAKSASDVVKNFVNVSLFALIGNNSYWFLTKREQLRSVIKKAKQSDNYTIRSGLFTEKHQKRLAVIKRILFIFYAFNISNEFFVYLPDRTNVDEYKFSMTTCVGLEPLTSAPNRQICKFFLGLQELTICSVVLNYQTMMLFLVAHTALMYRFLADELMTFNSYGGKRPNNNAEIRDKLNAIVQQYALTLEVANDVKALYSMPIGVNFGSNAACICFFFFLTLQEYLSFMPVLVYCLLVFFLYCFLCQSLSNAAELFERSVYSCGWENFGVRERRAIYIVLIQAQKPVEILAADLIPVNMSTFASTVRAIYQFVTVVKL